MIGTAFGTYNQKLVAAPLLLDLYPTTGVAYSLRKLRTAYAGSAIRVRRSSDNTEQDIGFVNNQLDTTSLLTFVGAGNGFVTTWYDQGSSSNNSINIVASMQPKIVNNGDILLNNGLPSIYFDGILNNQLSFNAINNIKSIFLVKNAAITNGYALIGNNSNDNFFGLRSVSQTRIRVNVSNVDFNLTDFNYSIALSEYHKKSTNEHYYYVNSSGANNNPMLNINSLELNSLMNRNNSFYLDGFLSEVIIYEDEQFDNKLEIDTDINNYYSIY